MGTKITINTNLAGHNPGDTIEVTPKTADYLTTQGYVQPSKADTKTKTKNDDK